MSFKVSTLNLSPDAGTASAAFGLVERGELDSTALAALLGKFTALDAVQNHEHDPQILVLTSSAKYLIRTNRGRLHLYNARDTSQPAVELALPALLEVLGGAALPPAADSGEPDLLAPAPVKRKNHGPLAAVLLLIGVGLNAWGIYDYLNREEDPLPPAYTPVTGEVPLNVLKRQLVGTFATGFEAGDRVITINTDGTIKFHLLALGDAGRLVPASVTADTYVFGQRSGGLNCLATAASGQVDVGVDGSLHYYGDTYKRFTPAGN